MMETLKYSWWGAATQERIRTEAQRSTGRAMQNVRLCPLSDPNCNERKP